MTNIGADARKENCKKMRYIGNIPAKADAKGRYFLPAMFRRILQESGELGLVLCRDSFQSCLVLYPQRVWSERVAMLKKRVSPFNRRESMLLRQFMADADVVNLDNDGRILIPKRCAEAVSLTKDVCFLGVDDVIEIWPKEVADKPFMDRAEFVNGLEELMAPVSSDSDEEMMEYIDIDQYKNR